MSLRVYIASSSFARHDDGPLRVLRERGLDVVLNMTGRRLPADDLVRKARGATGIIAGLERYDADVLDRLPDLRCISRCGVGLDNIDLAAAGQKGIQIFNTPKVVVAPVVELTLALIFDVLRRVTAHTVSMRQRKWERLTGTQLAGKHVGVLGLGRIGRRVAEMLGQLGARVAGHDLQPDADWARDQGVTLLGLDELLKVADILTVHVSVDGKNPLHLDAAHLARMKPGAIVINTSRGGVIDEAALVDALKSGHLAAAGLDVYTQEPYTGPLCDCTSAVLTPHIATFTRECRVAMEHEAAENLARCLL